MMVVVLLAVEFSRLGVRRVGPRASAVALVMYVERVRLGPP